MIDCRLHIVPRGPWITPFHADTLFGHLAWILAATQDAPWFEAWLARQASADPALVLSDAFPQDLLPAPLLPAQPLVRAPFPDQLAAFRAARDAGASNWLTAGAFEARRRGDLAAGTTDPRTASLTVKNAIDRTTGSTLDEGGLYSLAAAQLPAGSHLTAYVRVADDHLEPLQAACALLPVWGWGKRASAGYGALASARLEPWDGFPPLADANAVVLLSHWTPAPADPTDGLWRLSVKYGRVGMAPANPFKKPILQLEPGSTLRDPAPRAWYGRMLAGIAADPAVVHYGLAYAVPLRYPLAPAA